MWLLLKFKVHGSRFNGRGKKKVLTCLKCLKLKTMVVTKTSWTVIVGGFYRSGRSGLFLISFFEFIKPLNREP
jgi:hypothetical protein